MIQHKTATKPIAPTIKEVEAMKTLCMQYAGDIALACYGELTRLYSISSHYNMVKILDFCSTLSTDAYKKSCEDFAVMGSIINSPGEINSQKIQQTCSNFPKVQQVVCANTSISLLLEISKNHIPTTIDFCTKYAHGFKRICFSKIGEISSRIIPLEERKKLCLKAPKEYFKECTDSSSKPPVGSPIYMRVIDILL